MPPYRREVRASTPRPTQAPRPRAVPPSARGGAWVLGATACCTLAAVLTPLTGLWWLIAASFVLSTVATMAFVALRPHVEPRAVAVAAGVVLLVAVIIPPTGSHDLWSYSMVGRTVVAHHSNPYVRSPSEFPDDPLLSRVGAGHRGGTTPYGPAFVAYAAGVAVVAGVHPTLERLGYQVGAALAVALALALLWRATKSTIPLVLLALHPVVASTIVNGAHNDAFVGLGILAAVLLAREDRSRSAGWILALAALVKMTAGLALLPVAAWAWVRGGRRAAISVSAPLISLTLLFVIAVPGMWHSIAGANAGIVTRVSAWTFVSHARSWIPQLAHIRNFADLITKASLVVITAAAIVAAYQVWRTRGGLDRATTIATASWLFAGAYILPWYAGWSLPVAALKPRSQLTVLVAVNAGLIAAAHAIPREMLSGDSLFVLTVNDLAPILLLAAFALEVFANSRTRHPA